MAEEHQALPEHRQRVLSEDDLAFYRENGYVVVQQAIPMVNVNRMVDDIWNFLGFDRKDLDSCYRLPLLPNGFVPVYHSQAEWDNRTYGRVYNAFADLWGRHDLWVSIDRCGIKLPFSEKHKSHSNSGFIHWDMDPTTYDPEHMQQLQGVLCLCDTNVDMGGFHCYPGMNQYFKELMKTTGILDTDVQKFYARATPINVPQPETTLRDREHRVVPTRAGDLIIWKGEIAHGNGKNVTDIPRLAQYICMYPAEPEDYSFRSSRIECWKNTLPGRAVAYPQLPRHLGYPPKDHKPERDEPAVLTDLGQKLLGLQDW